MNICDRYYPNINNEQQCQACEFLVISLGIESYILPDHEEYEITDMEMHNDTVSFRIENIDNKRLYQDLVTIDEFFNGRNLDMDTDNHIGEEVDRNTCYRYSQWDDGAYVFHPVGKWVFS